MKEQDQPKDFAPKASESPAAREAALPSGVAGASAEDVLEEEPEDDALQLRFDQWCEAQVEGGRSAGQTPDAAPAEFRSLMMVGEALRDTLHARQESVPEAEFSALWSRISAETQIQGRRQGETPERESVGVLEWIRSTLFRPPVYLLAGAAACGLLWINFAPGSGADKVNKSEFRTAEVRKKSQEAGAKLSAHDGSSLPSAALGNKVENVGQGAGSQLADNTPATSDSEAKPGIDSGSAAADKDEQNHIERIDFAGVSGRISKINVPRGTTTVIWIDADEVDKSKGKKAQDL